MLYLPILSTAPERSEHMNYYQLERYMKAWAQYDRDAYNEMYMLAESRNLLRSRGRDIGNLFYHNKEKEDEIKRLYELLKEYYGTVTEEKAQRRETFKRYKKRTDNPFDIKNSEQYHRVMKNIDKVWSELYYEFNPSEVGTLYNAVSMETQEVQMQYILEFLDEQGAPNTVKWVQDAIRHTTYEDVASWFS